MKMRLVIAATLLAGGLASTGWSVWRADLRFPHERHSRLFTSCESCHSGIVSGETDRIYPDASVCESCHNGTDAKTIGWRGPARTATNLKFSHADHAKELAKTGEKQGCLACHLDDHGVRQASSTMAVARAAPDKCLGCHRHEAPAHLAEANVCATCHVPLANATALPDSVIVRFPKPAEHARPEFLATHGASLGDVSRCATCHTRESCARCHPNADRLAAVASLGTDARVARLMSGKPPRYNTPDDHLRAQWSTEHAAAARQKAQSCANCHAQESCRSCHQGDLGSKTINALSVGGRGNGPGVRLQVERRSLVDRPTRTTDPPVAIRITSNDSVPPKTVRVHAAGFGADHSAAASSGRTTCSGCHEQRFCESCHEGVSGGRRFHTAAYMSKHAADAYGQEKNCSSCHNTESFCRSCHVKNGLNANGNGGVAAHTGQPAWLLQHGEAARQGLAGCTSCHQQRDCLRCHSTLSWKVNPHGANFDARRVSARNKQMCLTCHVGDPLKQ